jgi:hypothetical protein
MYPKKRANQLKKSSRRKRVSRLSTIDEEEGKEIPTVAHRLHHIISSPHPSIRTFYPSLSTLFFAAGETIFLSRASAIYHQRASSATAILIITYK